NKPNKYPSHFTTHKSPIPNHLRYRIKRLLFRAQDVFKRKSQHQLSADNPCKPNGFKTVVSIISLRSIFISVEKLFKLSQNRPIDYYLCPTTTSPTLLTKTK